MSDLVTGLVEIRSSWVTSHVHNEAAHHTIGDVFAPVLIDDLLKHSTSVRCVRPATAEEEHAMDLYLREGQQCTSTALLFDVRGRHIAGTQRALRRQLSQDMLERKVTRAFATQCAAREERPRADDLEGMYDTYRTHGCSVVAPADGCYFKLLLHFLRTGFDPPVAAGEDMHDLRKYTTSYPQLWFQHEATNMRAYEKWERQASLFMTDPVATRPEHLFPIFPHQQ
jgi:hypothetical protein